MDDRVSRVSTLFLLSCLLIPACEVKVTTSSSFPELTDLELMTLRHDDLAIGAVLELADFNFDGHLDLLMGNPAVHEGWRGSVLVYDSTDLSVLAHAYPCLPPDAPASGWESFGGSLVAADFNGDGRMDLAVGNPLGFGSAASRCGEVWVYPGPIDSCRYLRIEPMDPVEGGEFGRTLAAGDLDQDGFPDLIVSQPSSRDTARASVSVFTGRTLELVQNIPTPLEGSQFGASVEIVPLNSGTLALAVGAPSSLDPSHSSDAAVHVFDGSGDEIGRLLPGHTDPAFFARSLTSGDLDGDHRVDLVLSDRSTEPGIALINSETWRELWRLPIDRATGIEEPPGGIQAIADLTGDGRDELLLLGSREQPVSVLFLTPLRSRAFLRFDSPISAAAAADFDDDGNVELILSTCDLLLGRGNQTTIRVIELRR